MDPIENRLTSVEVRVLRLETERDQLHDRMTTLSQQISDLASGMYLGFETIRKREERIETAQADLRANLFDIIQTAVRPLLPKQE